MKTLSIFHNKILRGFLKLSKSSPVTALYFLLGELPIEARLHIDVLSLFYNIWSNPDTTIHKVVKYILQMTSEKSTTWSCHLRLISLKYGLPDPLTLLDTGHWSKTKWKTLTKTKITVFFENQLRSQAMQNSKMKYLNVQILGLSGIPHPALQNIKTTQDSLKLRAHLKFLTGDYLTAERLSIDQGTNPKCRLCSAPCESTEHILTQCRATSDIYERLLPHSTYLENPS